MALVWALFSIHHRSAIPMPLCARNAGKQKVNNTCANCNEVDSRDHKDHNTPCKRKTHFQPSGMLGPQYRKSEVLSMRDIAWKHIAYFRNYPCSNTNPGPAAELAALRLPTILTGGEQAKGKCKLERSVRCVFIWNLPVYFKKRPIK